MNISACTVNVKMNAIDRKGLAVVALAKSEPISALAARHGVSRPLVYRQMHKASAALDELFSPTQADDVEEVLFTLPVTRRWIKKASLGLTLIGHASKRGVMEFMRDLVGVSVRAWFAMAADRVDGHKSLVCLTLQPIWQRYQNTG